jgi:dolichol-phosphate mannosyltransferase
MPDISAHSDVSDSAQAALEIPELNPDIVLSVVTPAYNEAENLPIFYERLRKTLDLLDVSWECLVIDDHSSDATFSVASGLARADGRLRAVRLARNFGSHLAVLCGLHLSRGKGVAVMAADLQDPPENLPMLLESWQKGVDVVWAVRAGRPGERARTVLFSRLFYWMMKRLVGIREMPSMGADFFLLDRKVVDVLANFRECNVSIVSLITWMGFRQSAVSYTKEARLHGRSGWTLAKKVKILVDSITAFSYFPIRGISYVGVGIALLGFLYAVVIIINGLRGNPVIGWSSLMVVVLVIGGTQMVMMGVLGEYLWRALDESRCRPQYWIESETKNIRPD